MKCYYNKIIFIALVIITIMLAIILGLYVNQTKFLDYASVIYLSNLYAYIETQLLPLTDDLSSDEWDQRIGYLSLSGNMLSPSTKKYGDYGKICEMIMYFHGVSYENYSEAIGLLRTLKISFNTSSPVSVKVVSGDIDTIIEELKYMSRVNTT